MLGEGKTMFNIGQVVIIAIGMFITGYVKSNIDHKKQNDQS